jgi:hypothetical protein
MESKIETNLLAQILIKGNLNINSILYKQHNFILNKVFHIYHQYVIPPRGEDSRHLPLAENLTGRLDIHVGVFVFLPQCLAIIM